MSRARVDGFTLVEVMVSTVVGLMAIGAIYAIGATSSQRFIEQQKISTTQSNLRFAIDHLRRDIARAGLFATPNAQRENSCGVAPPTLPLVGGGNGPLGALQYYEGDSSIVDPDDVNPNTRADQLRVLGNFVTSDRYYANSDGTLTELYFQTDTQAFRRSFLARPSTLTGGIPDLNPLFTRLAWSNRLVHIETAERLHFFLSTVSTASGIVDTGATRGIKLSTALPSDSACHVAGDTVTVSPLGWIDFSVIDPFAGGSELDYSEMISAIGTTISASEVLEAPNPVLVRRELDPATGNLIGNRIQIIAEHVVDFKVSFIVDKDDGTGAQLIDDESAIVPETFINGSGAGATAANEGPEKVHMVIVELAVRTAIEDPKLPFVDPSAAPDAGADAGFPTSFDIDPDAIGSARIRRARVEIPVTNITMRDL